MQGEASFNTWTTVFLVAALHGLVLSLFFLFRTKGRESSNKLLGLFLLLFSITLIDYVGYWTGYQRVYPHLIRLSSTFVFLFGPVLYLYVISILRPEKLFRLQTIVHFLPFIVFLAYMLPFYIQSGSAKLEYLEQVRSNPGFTAQAAGIISAKVLHLLSYSVVILIYTRFRLFRKKVRSNDFTTVSGRWLNIISYNFLGFSLCFALYYALVATIDFNVEYDYMISFAMAVFIFSVGYLGYLNEDFMLPDNSFNKYENSTLNSTDAVRYKNELLAYMDLEKPYRDGELRLDDLAGELSIPPHHLSQVLNERIGRNFFEFINDYRVKEAKEILSDPLKSHYKILRVAFESGFNNKTSFNKSFKEKTGLTPSEYRSRELDGSKSA